MSHFHIKNTLMTFQFLPGYISNKIFYSYKYKCTCFECILKRASLLGKEIKTWSSSKSLILNKDFTQIFDLDLWSKNSYCTYLPTYTIWMKCDLTGPKGDTLRYRRAFFQEGNLTLTIDSENCFKVIVHPLPTLYK